MRDLTVDFAAPVADVYAYLVDPTRRPQWQSSLRRVADVQGDGGVGTTWLDVTAIGAKPRMTTTVADPGVAWAERGTWRGVEADLRLDFRAHAAGSRVAATLELRTPKVLAPLGFVLRRLAPIGIRGDLQRAARRVGSPA